MKNRINTTELDEFPPGYVKSIERIAELVSQWGKDHPGVDVKVQFNYPDTVMVAGVIGDAIDNKFISVNEHGKAMIDHVVAEVKRELNDTPTAFMFRVAMEIILGKAES
jgi:hypothetical protein